MTQVTGTEPVVVTMALDKDSGMHTLLGIHISGIDSPAFHSEMKLEEWEEQMRQAGFSDEDEVAFVGFSPRSDSEVSALKILSTLEDTGAVPIFSLLKSIVTAVYWHDK